MSAPRLASGYTGSASVRRAPAPLRAEKGKTVSINTFAAIVALASALVTLAGALGIIRDAANHATRELDADVSAVFPILER